MFIGVLALFLSVGTPEVSAQTQTPPSDTYRDVSARALMTRARAARQRDIQGIDSYEGVLRERMYVGLTSPGFRRERGLFDQERVARIRWSRDGERAIQWIGARRAVPLIGADSREAAVERARDAREGRPSRREAGASLGDGLPEDLLQSADLPAFAFEPNADRLMFGGDWALNPMADTAAAHYRYASGDTLTISLPEGDLVLLEVRVEPRRADFNLVAGSLWFHQESASLVRATYKPARPFDMAIDEPEDADNLPPFLGPVQAEMEYITVEYSLHEGRFWLPRRFALQGEARVGRLVTIPLTVEWSAGQYRVNEAESEIPARGPLPPGWTRREQRVDAPDGSPRYVTVVVPVTDSLLMSPALGDDPPGRSVSSFSDDEIDDLRSELSALLPAFNPFRPALSLAPPRFNRVEGLSGGAVATMALTSQARVTAGARIGTVSPSEPELSARLSYGSTNRGWTTSGYLRELTGMNDFHNPFGVGSSIVNLTLGVNRGQFFRRDGVAVGTFRTGPSTRWTLEAFRERHSAVEVGTNFYVTQSFREAESPRLLAADEVTLGGVRGGYRWFSGLDPTGRILSGSVDTEVGFGDAAYQRLGASLAASGPLSAGVAGALEVRVGTAWSRRESFVPVQRGYFLGGSRTVRGFDVSEIRANDFALARLELGRGMSGARLTVFADAAWTGLKGADRSRIDFAGVGVGTSLLDGLIRADIARAVRGGRGWAFLFYLDGLF